jgi:GT2 family glycosyltransferase
VCSSDLTNISPSQSLLLGKAIDFVFASYLGSLGSASLHFPAKPVFVSALACINSAFWKNDLVTINGFDEEYELCEDTNMSYKVRSLGQRLLFDPKILVWHYRRDTVTRFAKQFFLYGMGRMRSMLTNKDYTSKGSLIPFAAGLIIVLSSFFWTLVPLVFFAVYLTTIFVKGIQGALKSKKTSFLLLVPALFAIEHVTYFFGMLYGVIKGKWTKPLGHCELLHHEIIRV